MRNPRPCVCGHEPSAHAPFYSSHCAPCWDSRSEVYPPCPRYRPAKRTEPLRAVGHAEWKRWLDSTGYTQRQLGTYRTPDPTKPAPAVDLSTATDQVPAPQRVRGHFWHKRLDEMEPPPVTRQEVEDIVVEVLQRFALIGTVNAR